MYSYSCSGLKFYDNTRNIVGYHQPFQVSAVISSSFDMVMNILEERRYSSLVGGVLSFSSLPKEGINGRAVDSSKVKECGIKTCCEQVDLMVEAWVNEFF